MSSPNEIIGLLFKVNLCQFLPQTFLNDATEDQLNSLLKQVDVFAHPCTNQLLHPHTLKL
jgi:hypothetical protein